MTITNNPKRNKFDHKLGWFYNEPDWHESSVKFHTGIDSEGQQSLILNLLSERLANNLTDVIWHWAGKHLKVKFKDINMMMEFDNRWSYSWTPSNTELIYNLPIANNIREFSNLLKVIITKIGNRCDEWDFGMSGFWFKNHNDCIKISILINQSLKNNFVYRPLTKSIIYMTVDGRKVNMNYRSPVNGLIGNGKFRLTGLTVSNLENRIDGVGCWQWCRTQYQPDSWHLVHPYIYFEHERDLTIFILRWL